MSRRWQVFHICLISFLFILLSCSHYSGLLVGVPVAGNIFVSLSFDLSRHAVERFVYALLVTYAGWTLGVKGGIAVLLASALALLPRALVISPNPTDALVESITALIIGCLIIVLIEIYRRSQRQREQLMRVAAALRTSQRDYEELFTNASDAIWVHDLEGKIIMANNACENLTSHSAAELVGKNVSEFLPLDSLLLAKEVKERLLQGEARDQRYEQRAIRSDKREAVFEMTTRLIKVGDEPVAFQHIARDVTEERRLRDNLRAQIQKNLLAQEEERKRIARELHDDIAQSILLVSRRLDNLMSGAKRKLAKAVMGELELVHGLSDGIYRDLQRYARDLRPSILDQMGLLAALNWLAEQLDKEMGIKAEVKADMLPSLPLETELVMFRIAQEALNNVRRHADASEVSIAVESDVHKIKMTISDNGKGFSMPELTEDLVVEGKLGVLGMKERARLIGGSLEINSEPGRGTTVVAEAAV